MERGEVFGHSNAGNPCDGRAVETHERRFGMRSKNMASYLLRRGFSFRMKIE
jgi:hypothetical protein